MCYHASFSFDKFQLAERYKIAVEEIPNGSALPLPYLNGFSFPMVPVIKKDPDKKVEWMQWGLIPHWTKNSGEAEKIRTMTLNAKAETLTQKPAFKHTLKSQRCIIPCSGFFEWREIQKKKYPYLIEANENIFSIAGIFDEWTEKESGEVVPTFSIITAPANHLLAQIHNTTQRMPLILSEELEEKWLQTPFEETILEQQIKHLDGLNLKAKPIAKDFQSKSATMGIEDFAKEVQYPEMAFYPID
jgi:putative SOS response-associated peptidase YedK